MSSRSSAEQSKVRERRIDLDALALAGSVAVPVLASFLLPAVPSRYRASVGLAVGAIVLVGLVIYLGRRLRRDLRETVVDLTAALTGFTTDSASGTLFKGALRNASLRVATVHRIVDTLAAAIPESTRHATLDDAGYQVGRSWGHDFLAECRRTGMDRESLDARLQLWSDYDATAGLGRFDFNMSADGNGSGRIRSGFLSDLDASSVLDYFFQGYLRGTLEQLIGRRLEVTLLNPTVERHEEATFVIAPFVASAG